MDITYAQLKAMKRKELIAITDKALGTLGYYSVNFCVEELERRRTSAFTWAIAVMTLVMMVATIVNVILFACA